MKFQLSYRLLRCLLCQQLRETKEGQGWYYLLLLLWRNQKQLWKNGNILVRYEQIGLRCTLLAVFVGNRSSCSCGMLLLMVVSWTYGETIIDGYPYRVLLRLRRRAEFCGGRRWIGTLLTVQLQRVDFCEYVLRIVQHLLPSRVRVQVPLVRVRVLVPVLVQLVIIII